MYFGVVYALSDGMFVLSGPNIESARGWRLRYARSKRAVEAVVTELRTLSFDSQELLRSSIPMLFQEGMRLANKPQTLPDVDYQRYRGETAFWLHA